eukprot:gnl/TRDRNA2_/TRDRNA2_136322_c3_seq1.p1 gnl/TRDRNA2_/TRDRNA2_136322_c3~~gnl/TRDRNA2_/TRDRNA2_136322_c3_seq1.p1  ORF type:complete len:271 (-),score=37.26 gnl/TRDRNA2_/TRDRNA2_136322_c3_seq1:68-823(-)
MAAGATEFTEGHPMVPIKPSGAVELKDFLVQELQTLQGPVLSNLEQQPEVHRRVVERAEAAYADTVRVERAVERRSAELLASPMIIGRQLPHLQERPTIASPTLQQRLIRVEAPVPAIRNVAGPQASPVGSPYLSTRSIRGETTVVKSPPVPAPAPAVRLGMLQTPSVAGSTTRVLSGERMDTAALSSVTLTRQASGVVQTRPLSPPQHVREISPELGVIYSRVSAPQPVGASSNLVYPQIAWSRPALPRG